MKKNESQKMITMPYQEYLDDLEAVRAEVYEQRIAPIRELIEVGVSLHKTIDRMPHVFWKFEGTKEKLMEQLCEILDMPTVDEMRKGL